MTVLTMKGWTLRLASIFMTMCASQSVKKLSIFITYSDMCPLYILFFFLLF